MNTILTRFFSMRTYYNQVGVAKLTNMTETQRNAKNLSKAEASTHKNAKLVLPLVFPKPSIRRR